MTGEKDQHDSGNKEGTVTDIISSVTSDEKESGDTINNNPDNEKKRKAEISVSSETTLAAEESTMPRAKKKKQKEKETIICDDGVEDNKKKEGGEKEQDNNSKRGGEEHGKLDVVMETSSMTVDNGQVKKNNEQDHKDEQELGTVDGDDNANVKIMEIENEDTLPVTRVEVSRNDGDEGDENSTNTKNVTNNAINNKEVLTNSDENGKMTPIVNDEHTNPYDSLKYIMVRNDGKPESLIKLVALKSLFSRQLPKMPRTYIARLVFDRRHTSLVILNDDPATKDTDEEVIGSICYRAFDEMRFAEIAFCAVNASHQVKGYGTKLMNLVKQEGARTGIEYFITYADNYAIGYFKKQGFTKNISMPKGRFQGLIKDYDGGTMMECYVHPSIDFTRIPEMLAAQRKFILSRIRLKALSHKVVYDPLPKSFSPHLEGISRANESAARALAVPGMIEAGWTMSDLMATTGQGKDLDRAKNALKSELLSIIRKVEEQQFSWPFREPVDPNEVHDYLDIIKEPIDLDTIDKHIRKGDHYKSRKMLYTDLMLMVNNCKLYNEEASTYVQCAMNLEKYLKVMFAAK